MLKLFSCRALLEACLLASLLHLGAAARLPVPFQSTDAPRVIGESTKLHATHCYS